MLFRLRSKSGISTVLGTLIFIGILFTCAIPFYLRINQANTYYTQVVDEMRRFDEKRGMEKIEVYAYPLGPTSDELKVYIKNRCALPVTIVAVWVNDVKEILTDATLPSSEDQTYPITGSFIVTRPAPGGTKNFYIEVLTNRGNRFASLTNPLINSGGTWSGGSVLSFNIVIYGHWFNEYLIKITGPNSFDRSVRVVIPLKGDSTMVKVDVPDLGTYHVHVTRERPTPVIPLIDGDYEITVAKPSVWIHATDPG